LYRDFPEIREAARARGGARAAVPMGYDTASLEALIMASEEGFASSMVFAPESAVRESERKLGRPLPPDIEVVDVADEAVAAAEAARAAGRGEATMLMKGLLKTSVLLKAVLDRDSGLRTGRVLSHVAVVFAPRQKRLFAVTDGGMVPRPTPEQLVEMIQNAAGVMRALGCARPRAALIAAVEVEDPNIPETITFARLAREGVEGVDLQGPLAVDGAMDPAAAGVKHIEGPVAGMADILVFPDITSGNAFAKGFMYMTDTEAGGLIAGAAAPIVMLSRSDTAPTKLNSLALGVVAGG
jgi:phosphate butyryltransferase